MLILSSGLFCNDCSKMIRGTYNYKESTYDSPSKFKSLVNYLKLIKSVIQLRKIRCLCSKF